jgi:cysteine protease ATG4
VAQLLRQAVKNAAKENSDFDRLNVYVAQDCAVYIQDIIDECTVKAKSSSTVPWQQSQEPQDDDWKSLILLVPLRLGQEKMNPIYNECLKAMLSMDNCIGIIGGRPRHSLYFIGYQEEKLIHLDPHYCQDMVDVTQENFNLSSFHCKSPRKMKMTKMDPCCCIGFYCRTKEKFLDFVESVQPFLLPKRQSSSSSAQYHQYQQTSHSYPMFVFCQGRSSEQHMEIPPRLSYGTDCSYLDEMNLSADLETDEEDDESGNFYVV